MFTPRMFGKYFLYERLAVGGMAEIFRAKMYGVDGFEKNMVLKQILPQYSRNKEFIQMFIDEAKITVSLSHGNIVPVFELGEIDGIYYISMEEVDGKSLGEVMDAGLDQGYRLSIPHALFVTIEMLAGLDYAHRKTDEKGRPLGIVHRDISPQNILISYDGDVKIVDFGIARAATKVHSTQAGVIKGKFGYMSPEQALGLDVDGRSDIFAAGILLYEMLTLERLFQGTTDGMTLDRVKRADVPTPSRTNPNLPPQLDAIVFKALERDPQDRFQSAAEMRLAVSRFLYSMSEEASAHTLSGYVKKLFEEQLKQRAKQPPIAMPKELADSNRPDSQPSAARPVDGPSVKQSPRSESLSPSPDSLFGPIPRAPAAPITDDADVLEDDFTYMKTGGRLKWILVILALGLVLTGGILWHDDIAHVLSTVSDVMEQSAQRLAQKSLGTLYVRSRPKGASVYFSNRKVGTTDMRIANIDPTREYELILTLEGYQPFSRKILPSDWKQDKKKMEIDVFKDFASDGLK